MFGGIIITGGKSYWTVLDVLPNQVEEFSCVLSVRGILALLPV